MEKGKTKILVTGANGFLASRMIEGYGSGGFSNQYEIVGLTRTQLDFTEYEKTESKIREIEPDIVVHCGAVSDVAACEREPELSYKVNVSGTENIARVCGEYNIKLIYCSSDQVYLGHKGSAPHTENEELAPPHVYGRQKITAEQKCIALCRDSVCLRLSWMYDWSIREGIEHGSLVSNLLHAVETGAEIKYPLYDFRSITNVREVVCHMEKVFELPGGIYNFGSENDLCTCDVVKYILKLVNATNVKVKENREAFADNPRNLRMDISKIRGYGIDFLSTVDGLKDTIATMSG